MKITKEASEIVVRIPFTSKRSNPWDDTINSPMNTLCGFIVHHKSNGSDYTEMGLAYLIDMDYKGKEDQVGDFAVMWHGEEDEFRKMCQDVGLDIYTYTL